MAEDADRSTDNNRITYETVTGNEDGTHPLMSHDVLVPIPFNR